MPDPTPNVLILAGDNPFAMQMEVDGLLAGLTASTGDAGIADLNTTRIDGRSFNEDELRTATGAFPFLAERRLVIVNDPPLGRYTTNEAKERFKTLLAGIPPFATLTLVIEDSLERKDWRLLPEKHWLAQWARANPGKAEIKRMQLPTMYEMPAWIRQEAKRQGGQFSLEAAQALASHTGNQTRLASQEITKLLIYVDFRRAVEAEDVEELVTSGGQADIFQMVDAAAQGSASQALKHLHRLLEDQDPIYIFTMLVRQFRLMLLARECVEEHIVQVDQVASALHQPRFVAEKALNQCRRFSPAQLDAIYRRLLAMDEEFKSSQTPVVLALDTFIAGLSR